MVLIEEKPEADMADTTKQDASVVTTVVQCNPLSAQIEDDFDDFEEEDFDDDFDDDFEDDFEDDGFFEFEEDDDDLDTDDKFDDGKFDDKPKPKP